MRLVHNPIWTEEIKHLLADKIVDEQVLLTFDVMIAAMSGFGSFELVPNVNGTKKSVHFRMSGTSYFAFIANQHWLLWYFRRPGFQQGLFEMTELQAQFPTLLPSLRTDLSKVEGVIKLCSPADAGSILGYVAGFVRRMS